MLYIFSFTVSRRNLKSKPITTQTHSSISRRGNTYVVRIITKLFNEKEVIMTTAIDYIIFLAFIIIYFPYVYYFCVFLYEYIRDKWRERRKVDAIN